MKRFPFYLPLLALSLLSHSARAENIPAGTAAEFQAALVTAQNNGVDDTIRLSAATFSTLDNGNAPFLYINNGAEALTIQGSGRDSTFLDGGGNTAVLQIIGGQNLIRVSDLSSRDGVAGGGSGLFITTTNGPVEVENTLIGNNQATLNTGGLFITSQQGNISVKNNAIQDNSAVNTIGGFSIASVQGTINFEDNTVSGNSTPTVLGGGQLNTSNDITVLGNHFDNNTGTAGIGGLIVSSITGNILLDRNTFTNHHITGSSAALQIFGNATLTFTNNLIQNNSSTMGSQGAGILAADDIVFGNNLILNNSAGTDVGGIELFADVSATLTNNTIAGNQAAGLQGGLLVMSNGPTTILDLYNNIAFDNLASGSPSDIVVFDNDGFDQGIPVNLFNNLYTSFVSDCKQTPACAPNAQVNSGANLVGENPLFVDLATGNVHLQASSPAIDAGDSNAPDMLPLDFDGNPRPFGSAPDLGALEAIPALVVQPGALNFGELGLGDSASLGVTLTNQGNTAVTVSSIQLEFDNDYALDLDAGTNPCGATPVLDAGASCDFVAIFSPTVEGAQNNQIQISSDDPLNPLLSVALTGSGSSSPINGGGCSLSPLSSMNLGSAWMAALPLLGLGYLRFRKGFKS